MSCKICLYLSNIIIYFSCDVDRKMPDVETIMEPWMGDQQDKEMPDFENADLLTVIDDVCGTCSFDIFHFTKHTLGILHYTRYGLGHYLYMSLLLCRYFYIINLCLWRQ